VQVKPKTRSRKSENAQWSNIWSSRRRTRKTGGRPRLRTRWRARFENEKDNESLLESEKTENKIFGDARVTRRRGAESASRFAVEERERANTGCTQVQNQRGEATVARLSARPGDGALYVGFETMRTSSSTNRERRKGVKREENEGEDVLLATDPRGDIAKIAVSERVKFY